MSGRRATLRTLLNSQPVPPTKHDAYETKVDFSLEIARMGGIPTFGLDPPTTDENIAPWVTPGLETCVTHANLASKFVFALRIPGQITKKDTCFF